MARKAGLLMILCSFTVMFFAVDAFAAGYALYEWGGRGYAQGGAVAARSEDAATVAYNPAGMTYLEGTHMMIGATGIYSRGTIEVRTDSQDHGSYKNKIEPGYPPHAYITQQVTEKVWLGIGVYSRFGLSTLYEQDWAGRYSVYKSGVEDLSITPEIAVEIIDGLSIGGGVEINYMKFDNRKVSRTLFPLVPVSEDIPTHFEADGWSVGANAGLMYEPVEWLSLGLVWRSTIKHRLEGDAEYDRGQAPVAVSAGIYENCNGWGTILLPQSITGGVAVKPVDDFEIEFDVTWTEWSCYENMEIIFDKHPYNSAPTSVSKSTKDWNDVWRFGAGAKYSATDWMDIMVGYIYDNSPQNEEHLDYAIPTGNRQLYSAGLGFNWENWVLDGYYTLVWSDSRTGDVQVNDATVAGSGNTSYHSTFKDVYSHIVGVSLGYRF